MSHRFDVLLADPPWRFAAWAGNRGSRTAESFYPTMSTEDLCALDPFVHEHTASCAALFLWVPCSAMPDGLRVIAAWGFTYRTVGFVWVKLPRARRLVAAVPARLHFGLGHYTRSQAELCLLGTRGRLPRGARNVEQVIFAPVREHSRKPDELYERIEALYPGRRYLELFARHRWPGWAAWGAEAPASLEGKA